MSGLDGLGWPTHKAIGSESETIMKSNRKASGDPMHRCVRGLWCWMLANGRSVRALCWTLPQYAWGNLHPFRHRTEPTIPRLILGRKQWISARKWELPRLDVSIMDGMGEHYGYPRHHAYVILWWNCRGYVWGVEYSTTNDQIHGPRP